MRVVVPPSGVEKQASDLTRQDVISIFEKFKLDVDSKKVNLWSIDSIFTKVFRSELHPDLLLLPSQLVVDYMRPDGHYFTQPYFRYFTAHCYAAIDFGDVSIIDEILDEAIELARLALNSCSTDLNNTKQDVLATYTSMIHASIQMAFYTKKFPLAKQLCKEWLDVYILRYPNYELGSKAFWQKSLGYSKMLVFSTLFNLDCSILRKAIKPILFMPASQSFPKDFLKTPEFQVISLENTVAISIVWRLKKTIYSQLYSNKIHCHDLSKLLFSIGQYSFRLEGDNKKHSVYIDRLKEYIFVERGLPFVPDEELVPLMCYWDKISGLVDSKGRNCEA